MFKLFKMSGAPPKVFQYYRQTKDTKEKAILEDLYNSYDALVKLKDVQSKDVQRRLDLETTRRMILSSVFEDLYKYGNDKGYPEYLILLFYQY